MTGGVRTSASNTRHRAHDFARVRLVQCLCREVVDGEKGLSDAWTGFTRFIFLNERPLDGYAWSGRRTSKKTKYFSSWRHIARYFKTKAKQRCRETQTRQCQTIERKILHRTRWWRVQTLACIVDADESTRPMVQGAVHMFHQEHITVKGMNSMTHCSLVHKFIHSNVSSIKKYQTQRQQLRKNGKNWRKFRHDSWQESETRKMWSMKQTIRAEKFILPHS